MKKEEKEVIQQRKIRFKNAVEMKTFAEHNPGIFINGHIEETDDGSFIHVNNHFIRLDRNFSPIIESLVIPECGMEPVADKVLLWKVRRHDQFSPEGLHVSASYTVSSGNGTQKITKHRYRWFIVKVGANFSRMLTGTDKPLVLGDEIVLADYVDGLAELPTVQDPTGYVLYDFTCLHYSEIQSYVRHTTPETILAKLTAGDII